MTTLDDKYLLIAKKSWDDMYINFITSHHPDDFDWGF